MDRVSPLISQGRRVREFYGRDYGMYPEKLDYRTWHLLEEAGLVRLSGADYDYYTRPMVGLLLMSLLADACAGTLKEKITDRTEAYQFLWGFAAAESGALVSESTSKAHISNTALERLVALTIKVIDTDDVSLSDILAMRKREARTGGNSYTAFRQRYADAIAECVRKLVNDAKTADDWEEIERQFHDSMKDDLASLRDEIGTASRGLLFSKEMLTVARGVSR